MATLKEAILLAVHAHRARAEQMGAPYILHPVRLMLRLRSPAEMMAQVPHDVAEDTP
jgi:(p)ppGpp synthase/HD superfamily hydrolase